MKQLIKKILREGLLGEIFIDEMAYPTGFNPAEFKSIKSFAGKQKYATEKLLGKIGAGSARAVFKIDDDKVLKVALNKKGLGQNMAESEYYKQNYDIVARVFEVDNDDMWIEMELAKKITPNRFAQLTNVNIKELDSFLSFKNPTRRFGSSLSKERINELEENKWINSLLELTFYYDYPLPGDFGRISSYGEVLRDGVPTVVLIDFGFTKDVGSEYYGRKF